MRAYDLRPAAPPARPPVPDSLDDFDAVYRACYQSVFRTVRAIVLDPALAEDVTQEVFVKAYRARDRYVAQGRLEAWLLRIATREAISHLRWRQVQERLSGSLRDLLRGPRTDPGAGDLVSDLLAQLSPGTRAAVVLSFYHGYRQREVAAMLDIPEGTVATRIANGIRQMRRRLPAEGFSFDAR
jgi:RNA polymerase sigma-70 factor (ECF subfamily)